MIRLLGGTLVILGCTALGIWHREQFGLRIQGLHTLEALLEMMMSQVRYHKATLPECCLLISPRMPSPYREALRSVYEEAADVDGGEFGPIFSEKMKECLERTPLGREEKELFLQFASCCGYQDAGMQLRSMEQYREQVDALAARLEGELRPKSRMAMGLGVMSGILLVILLL